MSTPPTGLTPDELLNWQLRDRLASNLNVHGIPANANETMARLVGKVQLIGKPNIDPLRFLGYGSVTMNVTTNNVQANSAAASLIPLLAEASGTATFTATPPTPTAAVVPKIEGFDRLDLVRGYTLVGWKSLTTTFGTHTTAAQVTANAWGTLTFTNFDSPSLNWTANNTRTVCEFAAPTNNNSMHTFGTVTAEGVLSLFIRRAANSTTTYHWRGILAPSVTAATTTNTISVAKMHVALFG